TPAAYTTSPLNTPDSDDFSPQLPVGAVAPDGPVTVDGVLGWWLGQLESRFALALFCNTRIPEPDMLRALVALQDETPGMKVVLALSPALAPRAPAGLHCVVDRQMTLARRYDAGDGACYLIRPDQHIAARWRTLDVGRIRAALKRATGAGSQEAAS